MGKAQTISFIGAGNLAWHLAPALDNAGYAVREVYSRNPAHATALVERLYQAEVKASLDFSTSGSEVFILAVSDDALEEVVKEIVLPEEAVLAHVSGSQPLQLLDYSATTNTGVFYPLQTFTRNAKMDFSTVPVFIESLHPETGNLLMDMGKAISQHVHRLTSEERKNLHLAAVFASNFTNHMLTISQDLMRTHNMSFDWLKPLIAETLNKALTIGPEHSQTGPARRGDLEVLDRHLERLQREVGLAEIYKGISQHILDWYGVE